MGKTPLISMSLHWYLNKTTFCASLCCAFLLFLMQTAAKFRILFADFKLVEPPITAVVFKISDLIWFDYGWVLFVPLFIVSPAFIARLLPAKRSQSADMILLIMFVLVAGAFALAFFLPMIPLEVGISSHSN